VVNNIKYKDHIIEEIKLNCLSERKVYMIEEYNEESVFKVVRHLDKIIMMDIERGIKSKDTEDINLFIDSYGGNLHDFYFLASAIRRYQKLGWRINTIGMGKTMSAGFFTLIIGSKRYAYEFCTLLCHDQRAFEYGYKTVRDKRVELKDWEKEWNTLKYLVKEYTDITEEQLEWYVERGLDWKMNTVEALELGVIDEIY